VRSTGKEPFALARAWNHGTYWNDTALNITFNFIFGQQQFRVVDSGIVRQHARARA